ncbi:uncharacterized protein METZ01_LOCUS76812, partial [marine metagenome]
MSSNTTPQAAAEETRSRRVPMTA